MGFLFLTWWMYTYVEIFAYIVNITWVSLEFILWETIHSSRLEVINWSLRETSWRQYESNREVQVYSSFSSRTQTKPNCDPDNSEQLSQSSRSSILQKTRSTNTSMSKTPRECLQRPLLTMKSLTFHLRNRWSWTNCFFYWGGDHVTMTGHVREGMGNRN